MNKEFWSDVLRSGAILGVVMSLSHIFELNLLVFSDMDFMDISIVYLIELIIVIVAFIWLLVRFTRRRAQVLSLSGTVTYSHLLLFILLTSMLTGALVGVADTIYISIVGYDNYVLGVVDRIDQLKQIYVDMGIQPSELVGFDNYATELRQMGQPSMFAAVFGQLYSYTFASLIPGFFIASVISRRYRRMGLNR